MGVLLDRFRVLLPTTQSPVEKFRALERWCNTFPVPEINLWELDPTTAATITYTTIGTLPIYTFHTNAPVSIDLVFDCSHTVAGAGLGEMRALFDGVTINAEQARLHEAAVRGTVFMSWDILPGGGLAPGLHTVDFQLRKSINAGTCNAAAGSTRARVTTWA